MDENEYRSTYHKLNQSRCQFEKTLLSRRSTCSRGKGFNLADREGVACQSQDARERCALLLETLRENARFALRLTEIDGALPFNKEIKVQTGGLLGLQKLIHPELESAEKVEDVYRLISLAEQKYGSLAALPFSEIMPSIVSFEGRKRRRS
jgi:hypothetical protein